MSASRLGGRVNLGNRMNGFRAVKAQKRQRLGATGRSGMNIVCEKVTACICERTQSDLSLLCPSDSPPDAKQHHLLHISR